MPASETHTHTEMLLVWVQGPIEALSASEGKRSKSCLGARCGPSTLQLSVFEAGQTRTGCMCYQRCDSHFALSCIHTRTAMHTAVMHVSSDHRFGSEESARGMCAENAGALNHALSCRAAKPAILQAFRLRNRA
jgi:hypothetical protein